MSLNMTATHPFEPMLLDVNPEAEFEGALLHNSLHIAKLGTSASET
jgi:hypothetical protein